MDKKIRVLLVDDEFIVAEAIATVLQLEAKIKVVGVAANGVMALQKARTLQPDVILLDLRLPDQPGVELIAELLHEVPTTRIVILTGFADDREVALAFRTGAVGYVLKTQAPHELVQAIENAYLGRSSVPPSVAKIMLHMINPPKPVATDAVNNLSVAERRVLAYVAQGLENKEIARLLRVSQPTIHAHVSNILTKLKLDNRTQAAIYAVKHGLVSIEPTHLVRR
jgi:NarL family two-component system response regulator LiaR